MIAGVRLSPDGQTALFDDQRGSIWRLDLQRGALDVLAGGTAFWAAFPVWHPDGQRVTVASIAAGSWDL